MTCAFPVIKFSFRQSDAVLSDTEILLSGLDDEFGKTRKVVAEVTQNNQKLSSKLLADLISEEAAEQEKLNIAQQINSIAGCVLTVDILKEMLFKTEKEYLISSTDKLYDSPGSRLFVCKNELERLTGWRKTDSPRFMYLDLNDTLEYIGISWFPDTLLKH